MSEKDPDVQAMEKAREAVGAMLTEMGVQHTRTQSRSLASTAVLTWLTKRVVAWSKDRAIAAIGAPDAYTCGFAEAILPILADTDFPFEKPITDWDRDTMARFLATAYELMQEQQAETFSDQDPQNWEIAV